MELRVATEHDLDSALDLLEVVAAERVYIGAEPPINRAATRSRWIRELLSSTSGTMLVAVDDARVVGALQMKGGGSVDIGMFVDPAMRGRGIGTALLDAAIAWARKTGVYKITLKVWPHNVGAIRLYARFGFEREAYLRRQYRRNSGEIWDCVIMSLVIAEDQEGPGGP
jgi:RimJ/RimL family protein N-acetyltransferase